MDSFLPLLTCRQLFSTDLSPASLEHVNPSLSPETLEREKAVWGAGRGLRPGSLTGEGRVAGAPGWGHGLPAGGAE